MCIALTDFLNTHADLLPFHLLVEKLVHRAAARLVTLPMGHSIAMHIKARASR